MPPPPLARLFLVALACSLAIGFSRPAPAQAAAPTRAEVQLLRAINHARGAYGLRHLRMGLRLETGARTWARYLLRRDAFYHGYLGGGTSENIGWLTCRRGWARALVRMWLNSPHHRTNLLDRSARRVGVGTARGSWKGFRNVWMAVTRFR